MPIFYCPNILETKELTPEEAAHCTRVLRLKEGDLINISDGKGTFYEAEITLATNKKCLVNIINTTTLERAPFYIHIAMGPTKNMERNELVAEKGTEIGLDELSFLKCRFSERKVIKDDRIEKILVSAMKQSKHAYLPKLNPLANFEEFVKRPFDGQKFIAHCYENDKKTLKNSYQVGNNALILIGPEGDFSPQEVNLALENGFIPVTLGDSRLRTETAAIYALSTINILNA